MMEQGSLADLLTLAKSGDDNKLAEMMAMNGGARLIRRRSLVT